MARTGSAPTASGESPTPSSPRNWSWPWAGPRPGHLPAATFLVGRDTRRSGPMLQAALSAGLASEGADVIDVGVLPTPALAWLSARRGIPAAVISASHNPFADNGIKLFAAGGVKLTRGGRRRPSRTSSTASSTRRPAAPGAPRGTGSARLTAEPGSGDAYVDHLARGWTAGGSTACGWWSTAPTGRPRGLAARVYERLGAEVVAIGCEPDGTNINAGCGSTSHRDPGRRRGRARGRPGPGPRR